MVPRLSELAPHGQRESGGGIHATLRSIFCPVLYLNNIPTSGLKNFVTVVDHFTVFELAYQGNLVLDLGSEIQFLYGVILLLQVFGDQNCFGIR